MYRLKQLRYNLSRVKIWQWLLIFIILGLIIAGMTVGILIAVWKDPNLSLSDNFLLWSEIKAATDAPFQLVTLMSAVRGVRAFFGTVPMAIIDNTISQSITMVAHHQLKPKSECAWTIMEKMQNWTGIPRGTLLYADTIKNDLNLPAETNTGEAPCAAFDFGMKSVDFKFHVSRKLSEKYPHLIEKLTKKIDGAPDGHEVERIEYPTGKPDVSSNQPITEKPAVYFFIHGGGWSLGSHGGYDPLMKATAWRFADRAIVVSVFYRHSPEYRYPIVHEDILQVLNFLHANQDGLGIDMTKLFLSGDSVGGGMVASMTAQGLNDPVRFPWGPNIKMIAPIYPVVCVLCTTTSYENYKYPPIPPAMHYFHLNYVYDLQDLYDWRLYPIYAPESVLKQFPKTVVAVVNYDVLKGQGLAFADMLEAMGVQTETAAFEGTHLSYGWGRPYQGHQMFLFLTDKLMEAMDDVL